MDFTSEEAIALHREKVRCKSSFVIASAAVIVPTGTEGYVNGWQNMKELRVTVGFNVPGRGHVVAFVSKTEWDRHIELVAQVH